MIILGIETSCDETGACIATIKDNRVILLSNILSSSQVIQSKWGGVVPEQAAREQIKTIVPVVTEALNEAGITKDEIDAIAVTLGPGLIGSLLVGVEFAKTLSAVWKKPIIPVNHLTAHFYANWIDVENQPLPSFPAIGLLISGGHTDLILIKDHGDYEYIGGTRDDAVGECFDKCARLLNLPYPGGPNLSKLAQKGDSNKFSLPRPMINSNDFDFSFSGLKTAVLNLVSNQKSKLKDSQQADLAASIEQAIIDVLIKKTFAAAVRYNTSNIIIAGGVASNKKLTDEFRNTMSKKISRGRIFIPPPHLCTDNGAMITAAAFFQKPTDNPIGIQANPNLSLHTLG